MVSRNLILFVSFLSIVFAQAPTGSIRGLVTDASGGAVPQAAVDVENKQLGLVRSVVTNTLGEYMVSALPPGSYEVRVAAPGFRTTTKPVELFVGRELTVNFSLEVGAEKQLITVEGEFTQVATSEHKVEGIISRQQIEHLPLNGRNALSWRACNPACWWVRASPAARTIL